MSQPGPALDGQSAPATNGAESPLRPIARVLPPLLDSLRGEDLVMMLYLFGGQSIRSWTEVRKLVHHPDFRRQKGKSTVGRDAKAANERVLRVLKGRSLADVDLAAIMIDGTPVGEQQVVWAIGVTIYGTKVPLTVVQGPSESPAVIRSLFENLVDDRGLDITDVLFVVDGGSALIKEVKRWTGGRAAIQRCRVHKVRGAIEDHLKTKQRRKVVEVADDGRERTLEEVLRKRLWNAWDRELPDEAANELKAIAAWLEGEHDCKSAADSVRRDIDDTLTVRRLGVDDNTLLKKLTSTNMIESPHDKVGSAKRRVKHWLGPESDMRERYLGGAVAVAERGWQPVGERASLERLTLAVVSGRHFDGERWALLTDTGSVRVASLPGVGEGRPEALAALCDLMRWADRRARPLELSPDVLAQSGAAEALEPLLSRCGFKWIAAGHGGRQGGHYERQPHLEGTMDWAAVPMVDVHLEAVPVPWLDNKAARAVVGRSLSSRPGLAQDAVCHGSAEALGLLGLEPGQQVSLDQVTAAAQGRHVLRQKEKGLRSRSSIPIVDSEGRRTGERTKGVACLGWEVTPPPTLVREWLASEPSRRVQIEQAIEASADAAVARSLPSGEMAGARVLEARAGGRDGSVLRVRGLVFGVANGARLRTPLLESMSSGKDSDREKVQADAESATIKVLEGEVARLGPPPRVAQRTQQSRAAITTEDLASRLEPLGERWARQVREEVGAWGPKLADLSLGSLQAERAQLSASFERAAVDPSGWIRHHFSDGATESPTWKEGVRVLALQRELAAREQSIASPGGVHALFDGYREVLGARRVQELVDRTERRYRELANRGTAWLTQRRDEITGLIEPIETMIDRKWAQMTLWCERARTAAEAGGVQHPKLERNEKRLGDRRGKLDEWMKLHGANAAEWAAVQAQLNEQLAREQTQRASARVAAVEPRAVERDPVGAGIGM